MVRRTVYQPCPLQSFLILLIETMIIIPLSTDAPIYHPPRGTFFLIAANVTVYLFQFMSWSTTGEYEIFRPFYLHFGTINPIQWVTAFFSTPVFYTFWGT